MNIRKDGGAVMSEERWKVLGATVVLRHPFLTVTMEQVCLPDGRIIDDWPIVDTRDFANVVVLNPAGEMLILEGYRHGLGRSSWQVVGGYLEAGEAPLAAIQRELLEETGYRSQEWQLLGSFVVDPNRRGGLGHFYLAQRAQLVARPTDDDLEGFQVRWVPPAEVKSALQDGRVGLMSNAVNIALALLMLPD
jgi:ADP-ribose diphosphatase